MINRDAAIKALQSFRYERFSIAPSIPGYARGIRMEVYFTDNVSNHYAYGENGKVHGYIAPVKYLNNHSAIQQMIGYSGTIVIVDREGNKYVAD